MAGHSKWKNIRIRKGKQDALRGNLFTKLSREIIVAAKMGGGDPSMNARLRVAIEKAREASVPVDNIKRAVARGTGEIEGESYDELTYEGYGPGGSAIMIEVYTENRNRTVGDLRTAFTKNGGSLAENGSVAWQFKYVGQITVSQTSLSEDDLTLLALDAGALDVLFEEGDIVVETAMEDLHRVNDELIKQGVKTSSAELAYIPTNKASITEEDTVRLLKLLDRLDELDDVKDTHVNVDFAEELEEE